MLLSNFLEKINSKVEIYNFTDIEINKIESDSRLIQKDDIFFAIQTFNSNGSLYIDKAVENGAKVVVCNINCCYNNEHVVIIKCNDTTTLLTEFLNILYNNKPKHIIGITGTCGKTSTAEFLRHAIQNLGFNSASFGTLGIKYKDMYLKEDTLTMRELVDLHKKLNQLKSEDNIDYVAMEMTSQGMDQRRCEGINIEIGVFLNLLNHEHLDYHKNLDNYLEAKMILFKNLLQKNSPVVLNADIPEFEKIRKVCMDNGHKILTFGYNGDIKILNIADVSDGLIVKFDYNNVIYELKTETIVKFQIYNLLATFGILIQLNLSNNINDIIIALNNIKQADGRMEFVGRKNNGAKIYIDYAHTEDSFDEVLKTVKEHLDISTNNKGKLFTLFGSGGDRDMSKRPLMGSIAQKYSDVVIITDDNPRTEDPKQIRKDILIGCPNAIEIADREIAIKKAIDMLKKDDILMLLGKGHERYQIIGRERMYFNEVEIVNNCINRS